MASEDLTAASSGALTARSTEAIAPTHRRLPRESDFMLEMDEEGIPKLTTAEAYEQYAINVEGRSPDKAKKARVRAVQLRAAELADEYGATSDVERQCLEAMAAYEWTLFKKHGRRQPSGYLRRAISDVGILKAADNAVSKKKPTAGYEALVAEACQRCSSSELSGTIPNSFPRRLSSMRRSE